MLSFLSPTVRSAQLRSKAVYALSGLCKHNFRAVKQLGESGGWEALSTALEGRSPSLSLHIVLTHRGSNRLEHHRSTEGRISFKRVTDPQRLGNTRCTLESTSTRLLICTRPSELARIDGQRPFFNSDIATCSGSFGGTWAAASPHQSINRSRSLWPRWRVRGRCGLRRKDCSVGAQNT